jgi:hypothetical protein
VHRKAALRYVVSRALNNAKGWAVKHPGKPVRWSRSPDVHPLVKSSGKRHRWTPEVQAAALDVRAEAVRTINLGAIERRYRKLDAQQRNAVLRHLTLLLPRTDKSGASRLMHTNLVADITSVVDGDPARALDLLRSLLDVEAGSTE